MLIQLAFGWTNSHIYQFQPFQQRDLEYTSYIDDMAMWGVTQIRADQGYAYPDLQKERVVYTYDFGEDWEHVITLKRTLTFDELKEIQLPSCTWSRGENCAEDGQPAEMAQPFDKDELNDNLKLWSRAGEQLIRGDDQGLLPDYFG